MRREVRAGHIRHRRLLQPVSLHQEVRGLSFRRGGRCAKTRNDLGVREERCRDERKFDVHYECPDCGVQGGEVIPKVIHHFWFGPAQKPALAQRCIASWRAALPDYEIKEWTEANYDVHKSAFAREAHANGKWAFLTDFARL